LVHPSPSWRDESEVWLPLREIGKRRKVILPEGGKKEEKDSFSVNLVRGKKKGP